ncbi:endosome/lysosome-associated apoptosis and autophagy regulator 1 [Erpetoichthys calabaricus]|uniref:Endosome-lysosome associated apoptosis and autophagy regulator 1 n=1 Tax=Erpetoichthys calabaricus TaxID=27687 RepID=A0A8C4SQE8_ERPCA|nr:endosome/lysosome-associated apoptosis and autophagy regulator 1 [Erpetoichthys calabaricus]
MVFSHWALVYLNSVVLLCGGVAGQSRQLPVCKESDYHYEYTECDSLGSRWRVAVPHTPEICTGLPDPIRGTECSFSCKAGEYLEMKNQECRKCSVGTYSLGTGIRIDEWDTLPPGFSNFAMTPTFEFHMSESNCSNSTWIPKGDYIASSVDECTSILSYSVNLKQSGKVTFDYYYPDARIFFEFYVQNDQCQSEGSQNQWMQITENKWISYNLDLQRGNNVLFWKTTGLSPDSSVPKPVLIRAVDITGVAYTSECFPCKAGTYSSKPGSSICSPCPANTYSNKGATVCQQCDKNSYSETGSGTCQKRLSCTEKDYFYIHMPCDVNGQTQLMYKWTEPKICSEDISGSVSLPASGEKVDCPPCNPGFFKTNTSSCEACPFGFYSNGTVCTKCPAGTEPVLGFEYKWWNVKPDNLKSKIYRADLSESDEFTGWEVAGDYIYTTPGLADNDYMTLTLNVPGFRSPHSVSDEFLNSELARVTFVFETICSGDCKFYFMAGTNERHTNSVEQWSDSAFKQSYTYIVTSNYTTSFTWAFQRTKSQSMERKFNSDMAKIYFINVTNVVNGVASRCRHCALGSSQSCVPCPAGHYIEVDTGTCHQCPSNTFLNLEHPYGPKACLPCGDHTKSNLMQTVCFNDCTFEVTRQEQLFHFDLSLLSNGTTFLMGPRFTSRGLKYFHQFSLSVCGNEGRQMAFCIENVTESRGIRSYVCQSTILPSEMRGVKNIISSQPFSLADRLIGVTAESTFHNITSPDDLFPGKTDVPDIIFYFRSNERTQACKDGRASAVRLRCDQTAVAIGGTVSLPSKCPEGTCDGCTYHFLWMTAHACPLCSERDYKEIETECVQGVQKTTYMWRTPRLCAAGVELPMEKVRACKSMSFWIKLGLSTGTLMAVLLVAIICYFWKKTQKLEYKYSRLMMNSNLKDCELPAADSCAIMEGEDIEDDLLFLTKKSIFGKIKSFSSKRTSDGFDSVPLKTSSGQNDIEL